MKQLEELVLSDNFISDLSPLANLPKLKNLFVNWNRIKDLKSLEPLFSKNQLESVGISFNQITDYSFLENKECSFDGFLTNDQFAHLITVAKGMITDLIKQGMTDREKYKALAVGLCRKATYGEVGGEFDFMAYGALINGKAVCQGYAEAYMMLCSLAGLQCYRAAGMAGDWSHLWNIVKLDGKYYHVDVTWMDTDDPEHVSEYYFLKSDFFFKGHDHTDFVIAPDLICDDYTWDFELE